MDLSRAEWTRLRAAVRSLDPQTAFVLVFAAVVVVLQFTLGDRSLFHNHLASAVPTAWQGLAGWGWWFGMQGLFGFVLPAAALGLFFQTTSTTSGLGWGTGASPHSSPPSIFPSWP